MASIVSPGKSKTPNIERENFRDRSDADVENRIRDVYWEVAFKLLKESNHPLPMWLIESLWKQD
jgi:hypothetical protein